MSAKVIQAFKTVKAIALCFAGASIALSGSTARGDVLAPPMTVQCWNPPQTASPGVYATNWLDCHIADPLVAGRAAARAFTKNPHGALFCWGAMDGYLAHHAEADVLINIPISTAWESYFRKAFGALAAAGAHPSLLVTDVEQNVADYNWALPAATQNLFARNTARAQRAAMTWPMRDAGFTCLLAGSGTVPTSVAINRGDDPSSIPIGNLDYTPDGVSSPMMYFSGSGFAGQKLPPLWNQLVSYINALHAVYPETQMPWIAYPSFGPGPHVQAYLLGELIKHARACGVTTLLYWNPNPASRPKGEDEAVFNLIAAANTIVATPFQNVQAPMDSDVITTGSVVSRLSDFEAAAALDVQASR